MKTRKGFTLVELLIVIVVIGILSAMMMLSSNEAVTSAKASNVVSNLRNLKTAALAYYADHMDELSREGATAPTISDITPYLSNSEISDIDNNKYDIKYGANSDIVGEKSWYIKYDAGNTGDGPRIKAKLKGRAKSVGLLGGESNGNPNTSDPVYGSTGNDWYVFYRVR